MGITSALITGLSGLSASQQQIDVVGNNIANVNTIGYKSTTLDFKTQFLENFSLGTAPDSTTGGTNPLQVGLGVQAGGITTDFTSGSLQVTGVPTNLAIQGDGFFVLNQGAQQVFTRDGSFQLNGQDQLVSSTGQFVQGYGVDASGNVASGTLQNITIPLGSGSVAQATSYQDITGSLNSDGTVATTLSETQGTDDLYLAGTGPNGTDPVNPPDATTLLTNVTNISGTPNFQVGDVINFTGKINGDATPTQQLTVTATTTLGDLENFMQGSLGINTTAGANGSTITQTSGVSLIPSTASTTAVNLDILGNAGSNNNITLDANSLTITRASGTPPTFNFNNVSTADGTSVTTQMQAYDSLGTNIPVTITASLVGTNTWQIYATSSGGTATGANINDAVGLGTLTFNSSGILTSTANPVVTINRTGSGAVPNLIFDLDFAGTTALSTQSSSPSTLTAQQTDGAPPATLGSFVIENNGIISGTYKNGVTRTLGQVALATFQNDEGLVNKGNNTYVSGPNSGNAVITTPGSLNAGTLTAGSLELSNVDLSTEFVDLISASTAFSAASRVITSSDQLLQQLLSAAQG